ncbi:MAG: DNA mismatch endonuclease Vsr [Aestuariivirga sp.]|uniref:very short patch repair endonuclease n=1 Tax=Aestuariivirga sp. TaxID=2650926 RepID=UPI0025BDA63A|nr:very short patch repair endonuclease [Aestuariivirga sp.]MCA3562574.1 DNA mismatch endonuclease Vsr [Aestuariivirga sp.]
MADFISKEARSRIMRSVKGKDTRPELKVRSLLHRLGYRFRLHRNDLPGKPDICLPRHKVVIFVHGCFWHHHTDCPGGRLPMSNREFWETKIARTMTRDESATVSLEALGWTVIVVWECDLEHRVVRLNLKSSQISSGVIQGKRR